MDKKNLIATGIQADVYSQDNMAVKVFHEDWPKTNVLYEALICARVEDIGINVPIVHEVAKIDGKWAIYMDRIEGKTLYDLLKEEPENATEYINKMVDLQLEVHSKRIPLLNKLKDKMSSQIKSLDTLDDAKKYDLLTRLDSMPKHVKLCHGDFNPKNIMIKDGKTYVLDWIDATQGNASADVGITYLILSLEMPNAAELYLNLFCEKSKTAKKYVQRWLPIVAAARLTQEIPEERELLMKWLDVFDYE